VIPPAASALVRALGLRPLPREGGWFVETWRSRETVPTEFGTRSLSTAILYLVAEAFPSTLHRLRFDEVWHWHLGDPVELLVVPEEGPPRRTILGPDLEAGMQVQAIVPARAWQGARVRPGGAWALCGTTMSPGFDPADFEGGDAAALAAAHPAHAELLRALAPPA
jgi:predicted cupin superfamily sugar epimerase